MVVAARPHTKLGQRDFRKIYPNVWRRDCFYGAVYPPGPPTYDQSKVFFRVFFLVWEENLAGARDGGESRVSVFAHSRLHVMSH